jgi:hypothetical protein
MRVFALLALLVLAVPTAYAADGPVLFGQGCYFLSTTSTVVRVLVNAREIEDGLVADLTSGELWVVRTLFNLEPQLLLPEQLADGCVFSAV